MLLEQEISQLSTTKSGFKLMPCITTGGLQRVRIASRYKYLDSALEMQKGKHAAMSA